MVTVSGEGELMGCVVARKEQGLVVVACCRWLGAGARREGDWVLTCLMVGLFANGRLKNKEGRRRRVWVRPREVHREEEGRWFAGSSFFSLVFFSDFV